MKVLKTFLMCLIILSYISYAWNDCPFGLVNDTYPGECGRYVDTNNNGICDHSEPSPSSGNMSSIVSSTMTSEEEEGIVDIEGRELKTKTLGFVCEYINLTERQCNDVIQIISKKLSEKNCNIHLDQNTLIYNIVKTCGVTPSYVKEIFNDYYYIPNKNNEVRIVKSQEKELTENKTISLNKKEEFKLDDNIIYLILLVLITLLYLITQYLAKTKKLNLLFVRKFWNWALLISFILLTISTLMMIFSIRIGNPLFLHKVSGFAFIVLSIIHVWERRNYFFKF